MSYRQATGAEHLASVLGPPTGRSKYSGGKASEDRATQGMSPPRQVEAPPPLTVLVADDEVHIVEFLALLLEDEGCKVLRAFNGLQAWEASERFHPDLVISDVMMPGMTGVDLARRIKATHNGSSPRIVLMSAVGEIAGLPDVQFLRKPFDIEHILDLVDRA
jgi:CheY-like chemotaxis protein